MSTSTTFVVEEFFSNGRQYYIAGRYAVFAALIPVAGNLLHHAVEHFLKGGLAKTTPLDDMKKKLGHKLPKIWDAFKTQANDPTLARFDDVISTLDEFEELRYPDPNAKGMQCTFDVTKAGAAAVAAMVASAPAAAASQNPKFHLGKAYKPEAREYLVKDNAVRAFVEAVSP